MESGATGLPCGNLPVSGSQRPETHPDYGRRKVWREGLQVAMKIKGSQGQKRVEWVKVEHPFTALSPAYEIHANHNEAQNSACASAIRVPIGGDRLCMRNA